MLYPMLVQVSNEMIGDTRVVNDMHERKVCGNVAMCLCHQLLVAFPWLQTTLLLCSVTVHYHTPVFCVFLCM